MAGRPVIFLDTHAAVFLHAGEIDQFTDTGRYILETEPLMLSPMAVLELDYLHEIGRIAFDSSLITEDLIRDISLTIPDRGWLAAMRIAAGLEWTRDPFDRVIVSHAMLEGCRLLTRDRTIQERFPHAVW